MALADYYQRGALAAAQVLSGFDEAAFRERLEAAPVVVAFDRRASRSADANLLLDLLIRILARFYPSVSLVGDEGTARLRDRLADLAHRINPAIELSERTAGVAGGIAVGNTVRSISNLTYAGARGWSALLDHSEPQPIGSTGNPFGAGAAAALAAAALFRGLFLDTARPEQAVIFSAFDGSRNPAGDPPPPRAALHAPVALVGAGAIGNAAVWALARTQLEGVLHVIDHETVELGNLQRYVLALRSDENADKVVIAARELTGHLRAQPSRVTWRSFVTNQTEVPSQVLLALDNARDRRLVQAGLPRWIANGWTQPGDLGVSIHPSFGEQGACVACLYLPDRSVPNEDELVAAALGIPDRVLEVRTLLHSGAAVPEEMLTLIADRLGQPAMAVLAYAGRPIRNLYVEGVCGGAVVPLGQVGETPLELHVPLAHQSALAGVLLAAALARSALGHDPVTTLITRVDVLRPLGQHPTQPAKRRLDGRCLCDDRDFAQRYAEKWIK